MRRRTLIKHLALFSGGVLLFPSCTFSGKKEQPDKVFLMDTRKLEILKAIVATIIPEDELPGAADLEVHHFVWDMASGTLPENDQKRFLKGFEEFEEQVKRQTPKSFGSLTEQQRIAALINTSGSNTDNRAYFIETVKSFTIKGYMQSKYIMTEIMPYELIPGRFGNCEQVEHGKRINIYG